MFDFITGNERIDNITLLKKYKVHYKVHLFLIHFYMNLYNINSIAYSIHFNKYYLPAAILIQLFKNIKGFFIIIVTKIKHNYSLPIQLNDIYIFKAELFT